MLDNQVNTNNRTIGTILPAGKMMDTMATAVAAAMATAAAAAAAVEAEGMAAKAMVKGGRRCLE